MTTNFVEGTWRISRLGEDASMLEKLHLDRHLAAYEFALSKLELKELVLDVACGYGVGVEKVAKVATSTVALDLASSALDEVPDLPGLFKIQANATKLPFSTNSADAILAFQLIEHVPRSGALAMLREFQRVIKPGGRAFVTTPNARWRLLPFQKPWNPYHVKEYRPREIMRLCKDAGLDNYVIMGLVGRNGAQEIELDRVRQDPWAVYLGVTGRYRWYMTKIARFFSRKRRSGDSVFPDRKSNPYKFGDNYRIGLDFMIVIEKSKRA